MAEARVEIGPRVLLPRVLLPRERGGSKPAGESARTLQRLQQLPAVHLASPRDVQSLRALVQLLLGGALQREGVRAFR
jgi:hypothetical protein